MMLTIMFLIIIHDLFILNDVVNRLIQAIFHHLVTFCVIFSRMFTISEMMPIAWDNTRDFGVQVIEALSGHHHLVWIVICSGFIINMWVNITVGDLYMVLM